MTPDKGVPSSDGLLPGQHLERGGFPSPIEAKQAEALPPLDRKRDPVHGEKGRPLVIHLQECPWSACGEETPGSGGDRKGQDGPCVTLDSSLMTSGASSRRSGLGARTRSLSSATSWSSGSSAVWAHSSAWRFETQTALVNPSLGPSLEGDGAGLGVDLGWVAGMEILAPAQALQAGSKEEGRDTDVSLGPTEY